MHTLYTVLEILAVVLALVVGATAIYILAAIIEDARHGTTSIDPIDSKPLEVTVTDTDGQWHRFKLGDGDGVGYAGIRIDVHTPNRISLSHYTDTEELPELVPGFFADDIDARGTDAWPK